MLTSGRVPSLRRLLLGLGIGWLVVSTAGSTQGAAHQPPVGKSFSASRTVTFTGYTAEVPRGWKVVDFRVRPHACLRHDTPAVYLGHAGDQRACPASVIGGAPGLHIEPLDLRSADLLTRSTLRAAPNGTFPAHQFPRQGPVTVAVESAGVLVTAVYSADTFAPVRHALVTGNAARSPTGSAPAVDVATHGNAAEVSAPGTFRGRGFDACTAPSQSAMNAWRNASPYRAVGVYIGGASRGCGQPNLTSEWVARQAAAGWHFIPTYVGRQAPCTGYSHRMSNDPQTARAQGRAEGRDAVARARALGLVASSTLYSDIEGYNNTIPSCSTAVLSYVSGWTSALHAKRYRAGVYSSAASGISDLSASYDSSHFKPPDGIWLAWWNYSPDVDGASYVPDTQWAHHRIHQYVGNVSESHGGSGITIDRNFLDVRSAANQNDGCPTNLNFTAYPLLRPGGVGAGVLAAQCLLNRRGFGPEDVTGTVDSSTATAIRAFKTSRGLPSDSFLGPHGWTALLSAGRSPYLQPGATDEAVRKVQRSLTAALERTVAITGTFDQGTRRAVVSYQTTRGLPTTGTVGADTWRALQRGR